VGGNLAGTKVMNSVYALQRQSKKYMGSMGVPMAVAPAGLSVKLYVGIKFKEVLPKSWAAVFNVISI